MRHRVFIAINLPEEIKEKLISYQEKIEEIFPPHPAEQGGGFVRWTKKENLHITLIFLGYVGDSEILEVCEASKEVVSKHQPFSLTLNKICYGPPKAVPARMIWVEGEKSKELTALKNDLERSLIERVNFSSETRAFSPHLTLARIKVWQWRLMEPEEIPEIEEEIFLNFPVYSIEIMESNLKRGGAEYTILETLPLSK